MWMHRGRLSPRRESTAGGGKQEARPAACKHESHGGCRCRPRRTLKGFVGGGDAEVAAGGRRRRRRRAGTLRRLRSLGGVLAAGRQRGVHAQQGAALGDLRGHKSARRWAAQPVRRGWRGAGGRLHTPQATGDASIAGCSAQCKACTQQACLHCGGAVRDVDAHAAAAQQRGLWAAAAVHCRSAVRRQICGAPGRGSSTCRRLSHCTRPAGGGWRRGCAACTIAAAAASGRGIQAARKCCSIFRRALAGGQQRQQCRCAAGALRGGQRRGPLLSCSCCAGLLFRRPLLGHRQRRAGGKERGSPVVHNRRRRLLARSPWRCRRGCRASRLGRAR